MAYLRENISPNQTLADWGEGRVAGLQPPPPLVGQFYPRKVNFGYFQFSLNIFYVRKSEEKGLGTSYNNIIFCPLPSICTHILSQEATLQYNITLNVEHGV